MSRPTMLSQQRSQLVVFLFVLITVLSVQTCYGFECYTGDGEVLRRKTCPSIGAMTFSDICFKKVAGTLEVKGETQRGCFNSLIASLITETEEIGCHAIPEKYGTGTICMCDTELCNSSHKISVSSTSLMAFSFLVLGTTVRLFG